jgi:hypothetical protein
MTGGILDFLTLPDTGRLAADVLRRQDLAVLRRVASGRISITPAPEPSTVSALTRLQIDGLAARDGGYWIANDLGRETVRANASCRDGSEGLRRPRVYHRDRAEAGVDDKVVDAIADYERRAAEARGIPTADLITRAMADTLPPPSAVLSTSARNGPGRLKRFTDGVVQALRWHGAALIVAMVKILAVVVRPFARRRMCDGRHSDLGIPVQSPESTRRR